MMDTKSATPPPPTRDRASIVHHYTPPPTKGEQRKAWWGAKGKHWADKAQVWSDNIGGKVNNFAEKRLHAEAFFPVTGDMPKEMDKVARILKAFTEEGVVTQEKKSKRKVLRKIPSHVIRKAKGLAIFTSMRSGIAPFGGAGGAGLVMAKLPDGTWSAPASITPNNISAGLLLGVDIYDCVLVINTQKALDSFGSHKVTLGTEIAVAAGPWGAGAAMEAGYERAPVFSYVKSRGLYAGVEVVGQVFVERFDENGLMYHWPGVKARDILQGKVQVPPEAKFLQQTLVDAETGRAQARTLGGALEAEVDKDGIPILAAASSLDLEEGEVLKLPPPPSVTTGSEYEDDPETEEIIRRSGLNPPSLPPRRPVASLDKESEAEGDVKAAEASAAAPLIASIPPPLPPRRGETPPDYDEPSAIDIPVIDTTPLEPLVFASPDSETTALALSPASASLSAILSPATLSAPLSPVALSPVAPASPELEASPRTPVASELATLPVSPVSPVSPMLQTPVSPIATVISAPASETEYKPTLGDLVAIGAPVEMDTAEQREWEESWLAMHADKLSLGDVEAGVVEVETKRESTDFGSKLVVEEKKIAEDKLGGEKALLAEKKVVEEDESLL